MSGSPDLEPTVRRAVGIAALRRLRRLVDEERRQEEENRLLVRRITWGLLIATAASACWLVLVAH